jgi:hypothetical protein
MARRAILLIGIKTYLRHGFILQMTVWRLPGATSERTHGLKYSLFFGRPGERIIGYDNEAGKGDHRHYRDHEEPYRFRSLGQLLTDFQADVRKETGDE